MKIDRYDVWSTTDWDLVAFDKSKLEVDKDPDGDWCKWEDVEKLIKENERLKKEIKRMKEFHCNYYDPKN